MIIYHKYKHTNFFFYEEYSQYSEKRKYRTEQVNVDVSNLKPQKSREYIKCYLFSDFD